MSGHNKWSKIKHKKGKTDSQKGASYTKVIREIVSAVKQGGGSPDTNFKLRLAIDHAREVNMPNSNVERAIKSALGAEDGTQLEEITYEAYAPAGGAAILVEVLTDNRNRTIAEVRSAIDKSGGKFAAAGSVAWMFDKKGIFTFEPGKTTEDQLMEIVLDAGADDIKVNDDKSIDVTCPPENLEKVKNAIESAKISFASAEITMIPKENVEVSNPDDLRRIVNLIDKLDELDDVQKVHSNYSCSDEVMKKAVES